MKKSRQVEFLLPAMAAEIENSELVRIKKQVEEINEILEIIFRIIEKRLSKLEVFLTKNYDQKY